MTSPSIGEYRFTKMRPIMGFIQLFRSMPELRNQGKKISFYAKRGSTYPLLKAQGLIFDENKPRHRTQRGRFTLK